MSPFKQRSHGSSLGSKSRSQGGGRVSSLLSKLYSLLALVVSVLIEISCSTSMSSRPDRSSEITAESQKHLSSHSQCASSQDSSIPPGQITPKHSDHGSSLQSFIDIEIEKLMNS